MDESEGLNRILPSGLQIRRSYASGVNRPSCTIRSCSSKTTRRLTDIDSMCSRLFHELSERILDLLPAVLPASHTR